MLKVYPDYYEKFKCIANKCKHNCCIGWEIDIDEKTLDFYNSVKGEFGVTLSNNIAGETPHFVLDENERCPFLNNRNLCDIIINLGEENICDICKEHPRFYNQLPDRVEVGLGLCCEEASRIILGNTNIVKLIAKGESDIYDEIISLRDDVIRLLQDRSFGLNKRFNNVFQIFGKNTEKIEIEKWIDFLLGLERMDNEWKDILSLLKQDLKNTNFSSFDEYMKDRQTEYEQLSVYLIYRHFANSFDYEEAYRICKFTFFAYNLMYCLGAVLFAKYKEFSFKKQVDLCRLFSAEIEYSDQNLDYILEKM